MLRKVWRVRFFLNNLLATTYKLNPELPPEVLPIVFDQRRQVLDVPNLDREVGLAPNSKVEEDGLVDLVDEFLLLRRDGHLHHQLGSHQDVHINQR